MIKKKAIRTFAAGFTLIEVVVAIGVFVSILFAGMGALSSGILAQKSSISSESSLREGSYLLEYMIRALRQAKRDSARECLNSPDSEYYLDGGSWIRFLNSENRCQQFSVSQDRAFEQKSQDSTFGLFGPEIAISSENAKIERMRFAVSEEDNFQPRVTVSLDVAGLNLQTTVSLRNLDVRQ